MVDGEDQKSEAAICRLLYNSHPKERTWLVPLHHSLPPNIVLPSLPPVLLGGGPHVVVGVAGRLVAAVDAAGAVAASAREAAADRVGCAAIVVVVMVVVGENEKVVALCPLLLSRSCRYCCARCCHCLCVPLLLAPFPLFLFLLFHCHWWGKEESYPRRLCTQPRGRVAIPVQGGREGGREGGKEGSEEEAPACFSMLWAGDRGLVLS